MNNKNDVTLLTAATLSMRGNLQYAESTQLSLNFAIILKALFQLTLPFNGLHFRCQLSKAEETATPERRARHVSFLISVDLYTPIWGHTWDLAGAVMNSLVLEGLWRGGGQLIINTHVSQYHMEALGSRYSPIVQSEITPTESHGPSLKKWPVRRSSFEFKTKVHRLLYFFIVFPTNPGKCGFRCLRDEWSANGFSHTRLGVWVRVCEGSSGLISF